MNSLLWNSLLVFRNPPSALEKLVSHKTFGFVAFAFRYKLKLITNNAGKLASAGPDCSFSRHIRGTWRGESRSFHLCFFETVSIVYHSWACVKKIAFFKFALTIRTHCVQIAWNILKFEFYCDLADTAHCDSVVAWKALKRLYATILSPWKTIGSIYQPEEHLKNSFTHPRLKW